MEDVFEVRSTGGQVYQTQDQIRSNLQSKVMEPASPSAQIKFVGEQLPASAVSVPSLFDTAISSESPAQLPDSEVQNSSSDPGADSAAPEQALPAGNADSSNSTGQDSSKAPEPPAPVSLRSVGYHMLLKQTRRTTRSRLYHASSRIDQTLDYGIDDDNGNLSGRKSARLYKSILQGKALVGGKAVVSLAHTVSFGKRAFRDVKDGSISGYRALASGTAFFVGEAGRTAWGGAKFTGRLLSDNVRDFHAGQGDLASSVPTQLKDTAYTTVQGTKGITRFARRMVYTIRHPILAGKAIIHTVLTAGSALFSFLPVLIPIILVIILFCSSLKSADPDLTGAWLQVTRLDAEFGKQATDQQGDGIDEWRYFLNGTPISRENMHVQTDCLLFLSYLDAKYQDYKLADVTAEIDQVHNALYKVERHTYTEERPVEPPEYLPPAEEGGAPIPVTYTVMVCETQITTVSFEDYLRLHGAELMTPEQRQAMDALQQVGPTTFRQELLSPFPGLNWAAHITSRFGWRCDPFTGDLTCHRALDIAMPAGTPIAGVMAGVVVTAEYHASYGNYVVLRDAAGNETLYAHMSSSCVTVGQSVPLGATIGYVGSTGNSTGNHLHIEYKKDGVQLNPQLYLLNEPSGV